LEAKLTLLIGRNDKIPIFLRARVLGFTWGKYSTEILMLDPVDYIIGADCFYDNSEGNHYHIYYSDKH